MKKQKISRGDVVLVLFPNSDLRTAKTRPALIVQANDLNTGLEQVIVAMITSRIFRANHPSRVKIIHSKPEGKKTGLLGDSVVMTDNLTTIFLSGIEKIIGKMTMERVEKALSHTPGMK